MDLVTARKLIAYAFRSKKGRTELNRQEFIREISLKGKFLSEEEASKFIEESKKAALITVDGDSITPMFSTVGIVIPLDFNVTASELFVASRDAPLSERMLESLLASGKMSRQEAMAEAKELQKNMRYINFEIALLAIMTDNCIDTSEFLKEIGS